MVAELQQRGAKPAEIDQFVKEREKDLLRDQIDQLLLVQKGKELTITVDAEISKQVAEIQKECAKIDPTCDRFRPLCYLGARSNRHVARGLSSRDAAITCSSSA